MREFVMDWKVVTLCSCENCELQVCFVYV